jgi:hypothetical protein
MTDYANVIPSLVALSLFLLFFYTTWQSAMTDMARQYVFERRDAVFDMAADGKLSFESAEYKIIRDAFNGLIRFAHELTWVRLAIHWGEAVEGPSVQSTIEGIKDSTVRAEVSRHLRRARYAMIAMIGLKSLPLVMALIVVGSISWCLGKWRDLFFQADRTLGEMIQQEAKAA